MNLAGTETRPYPLSRGRADRGEVDIALDPVLRIDKVLKRKGRRGGTDDPFAESEPALAELWKAAALGRPLVTNEALQHKAPLHRP